MQGFAHEDYDPVKVEALCCSPPTKLLGAKWHDSGPASPYSAIASYNRPLDITWVEWVKGLGFYGSEIWNGRISAPPLEDHQP